MFGSNYAELNIVPNYNIKNSYSSHSPKYNNDEFSTNKYQDNISKHDKSYYCGGNSSLAIRGMQMENSPLSELYFSEENMKRIQSQIKREAYRLSDGLFKLVVDQDKDDLLIMMRQIFFEHAKFLPHNIVRQVKQLNKHTLKYLMSDIMTNIRQNNAYLKDISNPVVPIALPMNVNNAGRKSLPSFTTTWNV